MLKSNSLKRIQLKQKSKLSELKWPIGIIISIMCVMALGVWTIKQANIQPVMMDDYYFESYGDVDENINDILLSQQKFDKKYNFNFNTKAFHIGENILKMNILTKDGKKEISDANITIKITRPDTNQFDKMLKVTNNNQGMYTFEKFDIQKLGRWQIKTKISIGDLTSFSTTEVNATN